MADTESLKLQKYPHNWLFLMVTKQDCIFNNFVGRVITSEKQTLKVQDNPLDVRTIQ
jgi:hypothetical protein